MPLPQFVWHWPQCVGSDDKSKHPLLHSTVPAGQAPHCPDTHSCPVLHAFPHEPQCVGSLAKSKHPSAHATSPDVHIQTLAKQIAPGPQTVVPHGSPLVPPVLLFDVVFEFVVSLLQPPTVPMNSAHEAKRNPPTKSFCRIASPRRNLPSHDLRVLGG